MAAQPAAGAVVAHVVVGAVGAVVQGAVLGQQGITQQAPAIRVGRSIRDAPSEFVEPTLVRDAGIDGHTTLARIEPHRLRALIEEDVGRYPGASSTEIQLPTVSEMAVLATAIVVE